MDSEIINVVNVELNNNSDLLFQLLIQIFFLEVNSLYVVDHQKRRFKFLIVH
jgi:hypothetical protein